MQDTLIDKIKRINRQNFDEQEINELLGVISSYCNNNFIYSEIKYTISYLEKIKRDSHKSGQFEKKLNDIKRELISLLSLNQ